MAKTTSNPTVEQIEALRSYITKANHGHGRMIGVTRQLVDAGYVTVSWTGTNDWTLTISAKGYNVLRIVCCSECAGRGTLTKLGGDWGKTPDTEVTCWMCKGTGARS